MFGAKKEELSLPFSAGGTCMSLELLLLNKGFSWENLLPCREAGDRGRWTGGAGSVSVRQTVPLNTSVMDISILWTSLG